MPLSTSVQKQPILFLDHAPAMGGAERSLLLLIQHLDPQRWSPHLGCMPGDLAARAQALDITAHILDFPRLRRSPRFLADWLVRARDIAHLAVKIKAQLLIANTVRSALYCLRASRLASIPFIWHMRDFWLSETRPRSPFLDYLGKNYLCRAASLVIANSSATAFHLPCIEKVYVVHNGIDTSRFNPSMDSPSFRRAHQIPLKAPLVGMVARLRPWKGQERFLHLASRVLGQLPETHFLLVGGDPFQVEASYAYRLKRLTQALGTGDRVTFTGHLDDVSPALAAMDVFVHPGDPEPFGLVNLEAMASGKPVVAFDHGALPEIVDPGVTGLLIPPGDVEGLAQAVIELLYDPKKRTLMGQRGRDRVEQHFTIQQAAAGVSSLFDQVIA